MQQRLQQIKISPLPIVLFVQLILIYWVFQPFFYDGENVVFCDSLDGLKNYFTYFTYLTQDSAIPSDFYTAMNYPFGEYIFYTDNTPTLSIPLKWFSDNIYDISPYAFRIFNWFCLSGILLSTLFTYLILKRLVKYIWLFSIFAITLPWLTPQIFRLGVGHFNLSFSWVYLVIFYVLILLYDERNHWTKVLKISGILWILTYLISFIHLYYLPMICLIIGIFGFVLAIWERKNRRKLVGWLTFAFGLPMFSLLSVWGTIRWNDTFYTLREKVEDAYNWTEWSLKIDGFYTNYDFSTLPFLFKSNLDFNYESFAYLGLFSLYGLLFLLIWLIVKTIQDKKQFKAAFKTYFSGEKGGIILLIFFAGLMCFNVAIGEYAKMFNNKLSFDNPLHPFKYARMIAGEVTQFRVLARFSWVCFWAFNLTIIYLFDRFFERHSKRWIRVLITVLVFCSVIDMLDMQHEVREANLPNPLTNQTIIEPIEELLKSVDTKQYQAILPLPIYTIGSENYEMMLQADDDWRTQTFVASLQAKLPLMSTDLSRSAVNQHEALLSICTKKGMNQLLKSTLKKQPILVIYNKNNEVWNIDYDNEIANNYLQHGKKVPEQYDMKLLKSVGDLELYEFRDW